MNFGVVGCGLIGQKRARALVSRHHVMGVADSDAARARKLAAETPGAAAFEDWRALLRNPDLDAVVVATTNNSLAEVTHAAVLAGKHVIVEKPAATHSTRLTPIIEDAARTGVHVQVGFNHRFHPAIQKARELIDEADVGDLMFIRGRYGHGGRLGYEREWRANPVLSGGGELLDQGVHLIDLARWFLGDFTSIEGHAATYFWDMPVDDNGFLSLRTARNQTAWLHASCTEWKNLFSFEIYARKAKVHVEGLGGSYGVERVSFYRMLPEMGPPETTVWEYPFPDRSWEAEIATFEKAIATGMADGPSLEDARAALRIVEQVYRTSGYDHHS